MEKNSEYVTQTWRGRGPRALPGCLSRGIRRTRECVLWILDSFKRHHSTVRYTINITNVLLVYRTRFSTLGSTEKNGIPGCSVLYSPGHTPDRPQLSSIFRVFFQSNPLYSIKSSVILGIICRYWCLLYCENLWNEYVSCVCRGGCTLADHYLS